MMKKYIALTVLTITLAGGILAGCGSGKDIGQDAAKEAAFADAQVSEGDTTRLRVTKDRDDGRQIYEVEFTAGNREYSYDIDASDGSILSTETEELQGSTGNSQGSASNNTTIQQVIRQMLHQERNRAPARTVRPSRPRTLPKMPEARMLRMDRAHKIPRHKTIRDRTAAQM